MTKPWREFEKLVTRIEQSLSPMGAIVTSPDKIPDKVTGQLREVDASIRYNIGSAPILVTIECRDRNSTQDITWLEQIKSKKDSVGAHQTIVVSREGFTEPAILYAKQHGLALRQISEVIDQFILNCINSLQLHFSRLEHQILDFRLGFWRDGNEKNKIDLIEELNDAIKVNKPFASDRRGMPVTLIELFEECYAEARDVIWEKLEAAKTKETIAILEGHFNKEDLSTQTTLGKRYLQAIQFKVKFLLDEKRMPTLQPIRYIDEDGKVLDSFSQSIDPDLGATVKVKFDWDQ